PARLVLLQILDALWGAPDEVARAEERHSREALLRLGEVAREEGVAGAREGERVFARVQLVVATLTAIVPAEERIERGQAHALVRIGGEPEEAIADLLLLGGAGRLRVGRGLALGGDEQLAPRLEPGDDRGVVVEGEPRELELLIAIERLGKRLLRLVEALLR